nr:hypothetical protein [uncultured Gemmiger sp.]
MSGLFADLCTFFGLSSQAPQNLCELIPWLFSVLLAIGLFLFVFGMLKSWLNSFNRRW